MRRNKTTNLLAPFHAINTNDLMQVGGVWQATGLDPYLVYRLDISANKGPVVVELDIEVLEGVVQPRLYFHRAAGFSQDSSSLMRLTGSARYKLFVYLSMPCEFLRLDPAETRCAFRLRQFTIRRSGVVTFMMRAMRNGTNVGEEWASLWRLATAVRSICDKGIAFERLDEYRNTSDPDAKYEKWIRYFDYSEVDRPGLVERLSKVKAQPRIAVLMPVYNTPAEFLDSAIRSVTDQIYQNWELCIADDGSTAPWIGPLLDSWKTRDTRIKVVHLLEQGRIAHATNAAFQMSSAEYVTCLDHDDILRPHALAEVVFALAKQPDAQLIYSDEDKIENDGHRRGPHFKPDWNPDLLLGQNYFNHLTVHRTENILKAGGWRKEYDGSQDYDLNLRIAYTVEPRNIIHIPKILYHWRSTADSMAQDENAKTYAVTSAKGAIEYHLAARDIAGTVEQIKCTNWFRVKYNLPDSPPLVSLIIPTRNGFNILKSCIMSIRSKTTYPNYEIIVVNNASDDRETIGYLKSLAATGIANVLPYPHDFNYSAINNFAVKEANGSVIGLVNNDVEVISPDWLGEMVSHALRGGIGCVGAKLYYPNGRVQHAGVIVGLGGVAGHSHRSVDGATNGYFGRLRLVQNVTAVTGACLVVRRDIYMEAGGLDEENLKVAFNDVDFCLKVRQLGYLNVMTPFAELYHHESVTRGLDISAESQDRFLNENQFMKNKWGKLLLSDPYYSPNLTLRYDDFSVNID